MPNLDLPAAVRTADKIQIKCYQVDRLGLVIRYVVVAGYYATDADGAPVPNGLGNATFVATTVLGEYAAHLPAPESLALIAAREPEAQAAMDAHPQAAKFADDYYTQLCLDHYAATALAALPEVTP